MKETRKITEGAILLGIYIVLLLITLYAPVISIISLLALPLPFVLYAARYDIKFSIWFIVLANFISMLFGSPLALMISLPATTVGIVMGYLFSKQKDRYAILGAATGVYLANYILLYVLTILLFQLDLAQLMEEASAQSVQTAESMLNALGQETTEEVIATYNTMIQQVLYLLPSLLVLASFISAWISQFLAGIFLRKFKVDVKPFPALRELVLPKSLLWYYLVVIILSLMSLEEGTTLYIAVVNLSFILMILMTIQGFSFLFFFFAQKGMSKAIPITILIITFLMPPLLYIIRMIGIIDIGFDLRKRLQK